MAILNYTTTIDAFKMVSEIEHILIKHCAKSVMKQYKEFCRMAGTGEGKTVEI